MAIDEQRFEAEWAQDRQVLASLAENGDRAELERVVDVSFAGPPAILETLMTRAADYGFTFGQFVEDEDADAPGIWRLDLDVVQTVEPDAIRALTRKCLEIEATFPGIDYDGWGCVAQDGSND